MKKAVSLGILCVCILIAAIFAAQDRDERLPALLAAEALQAIIEEASGETALQNEISLAGVARNRPAEEYLKGYFETAFILKKLKEYGFDEASLVDLPAEDPTTWDGEAGELWVLEPDKRKIADFNEVSDSLCQGSVTTEATAELVYVGAGSREEYYKGKSVRGKIVLINGYPEMARRIAVSKYGALGIVAFSSRQLPEFDRDEVGWGSLRHRKGDRPCFAFTIPRKTGNELREALERGTKIKVHASVKSRMVPYKEEMTVGLLKGRDFPDEELVFTAHIFEGFSHHGANDNASGCAAILETGRILKRLVAAKAIPPLRRSVRFLWVPEISGTAGYIKKYPEIARRFFANINHDMVGEGISLHRSAFRLITTPYSLPTYLNDVTAAFVEWMAETQRESQESGWRDKAVLAPAGTRDPFPFTIDPYGGGSDHIVFVDGVVRVPAVHFIVWPDMWYHTSADTPDKSDPTQLKRTAVISAAAALFLANAGPEEAARMMTEVAARQAGRLGRERMRAEKMIEAAGAKILPVSFQNAGNIVKQAFLREKDVLSSLRFFFKGDASLEKNLKIRLDGLDALHSTALREIEDAYALRCLQLKVEAVKPSPDPDEARLSRIVPARTPKMGSLMDFWRSREKFQSMGYKVPPGLAEAEEEIRNFIDGRRSILDIRDAASAEFSPLRLRDVEGYIRVLEKLGMVEIKSIS